MSGLGAEPDSESLPPTNILAIAADAREAAGERVPSSRTPADPGSWLIELARRLRDAPGVRRKAPIGDIVKETLPDPDRLARPGLLAVWKGEDAAALDLDQLGRLALETGVSQTSATVPGKGGHLLVATDGIRSDLLERDPYWAGFCSVIVNVNDILAMGGRPLALVQVMAYSDPRQGQAIARGIAAASTAYGVPVVGGHTHPPGESAAPKGEPGVENEVFAVKGNAVEDEQDGCNQPNENDEYDGYDEYDAEGEKEEDEDDVDKDGSGEDDGEGLDETATPIQVVDTLRSRLFQEPHLCVTALGVAGTRILRSDGARADETLMMAIDLRGAFKFHPTEDEYKKENSCGGGAFDTIAERSVPELQSLLGLLPLVAQRGLASACKDISNPGLAGTLGMLCETSGVGAILDLEQVPRPECVQGPPQPDEGTKTEMTEMTEKGPGGAGVREAALPAKGGKEAGQGMDHDILDWLLAYPGYGFIFSTPEHDVEELCALFTREGVTAAPCGRFTPLRRLQVTSSGQRALVWDFGAGDIITGLGSGTA